MTSLKNVWIAMIVIAIIAIIGVFTPVGQKTVKGFGSVQSVPDVTTTNLTTLNLSGNLMCVGGLCTNAQRIPMIQASSTLCAIQSPNATSTLTMAAVNFSSTPSYSQIYELAEDPTAFSSTTALVAAYGIGASGTASFIATTTGSTLVVAPSSFITLKLSTTTASATFAPVGYCSVEFQVI